MPLHLFQFGKELHEIETLGTFDPFFHDLDASVRKRQVDDVAPQFFGKSFIEECHRVEPCCGVLVPGHLQEALLRLCMDGGQPHEEVASRLEDQFVRRTRSNDERAQVRSV
jgi:hypothetical protein